MHLRTEDLLTLRDRDPADADKIARWRAAPGTTHAVERLERMRDALRALPELTPPAGCWQAIEARLTATAATTMTERAAARGAVLARAFGMAAALVLAVIAVLAATSTLQLSTPSTEGAQHGGVTSRGAVDDSQRLGESPRTVERRFERTVELPAAGGSVAQSFANLQRESAALEQLLAAISFQRAVMSGATASAIAGLEDRVARIDALMASTALPEDAETTLMRVRVDLLAALVDLRLAQADRLPF